MYNMYQKTLFQMPLNLVYRQSCQSRAEIRFFVHAIIPTVAIKSTLWYRFFNLETEIPSNLRAELR